MNTFWYSHSSLSHTAVKTSELQKYKTKQKKEILEKYNMISFILYKNTGKIYSILLKGKHTGSKTMKQKSLGGSVG